MDLDDALAELVAHSGDRLLRVAYQLTHDRAAAQDLVQDALLRVYRSMRRGGLPPEDWHAYLRRAVINEYLRARRLRSSGEVVTDRMPEQPVADSPEDQIADRAQLWAARSPRPGPTGSSPGSAPPPTTAPSSWPPSGTGPSPPARPGSPPRTGTSPPPR